MYPHERSLIKQLAGKPFEIIGVNSDRDRQKIRKTVKEKNLNWRSFWNGRQIASRWQITGWPTTYLIDAKGVIRYKNLRGKKLDLAIEELLREMKVKVKIGPHKEKE